MENNCLRVWKICTSVALLLFVVVSSMDCYVEYTTYLLDFEVYSAGDRVLDKTLNNNLVLMLILSIAQGILVYRPKVWRCGFAAFWGIIASIFTCLYAPTMNLVGQSFGGISSQSTHTTGFGWTAIVLSVVIVVLQFTGIVLCIHDRRM